MVCGSPERGIAKKHPQEDVFLAVFAVLFWVGIGFLRVDGCADEVWGIFGIWFRLVLILKISQKNFFAF